MVLKTLKKRVAKVAYDAIVGGHLKISKIKDCIQLNFNWPETQSDDIGFPDYTTYLKDRGERTVSRTPLGNMP